MSAEPESLKTLNVVIADDNRTQRLADILIQSQAREDGFLLNIRHPNSLEKALQQAGDPQSCDLLITARSFGQMTGIELAQRARKFNPGAAMVMAATLTEHTGLPDKARKAGINAIIEPADLEKKGALWKTVQDALSQRPKAEAGAGEPLKILLMDNESRMAQSLSTAIMEVAGENHRTAEVTIVTDVEQAQKKLANEKFDVMLADVSKTEAELAQDGQVMAHYYYSAKYETETLNYPDPISPRMHATLNAIKGMTQTTSGKPAILIMASAISNQLSKRASGMDIPVLRKEQIAGDIEFLWHRLDEAARRNQRPRSATKN